MRAVALVGLLIVGCADNAIFELTLVVSDAATAGATGEDRALLRFYSADRADPTGLPNAVPERQRATLMLPESGTSREQVSVVASGSQIESPLWLAVSYCGGSRPCGGFDDAEPVWVRYDRAFYRGEFTSHELTLPATGSTPETIDPCMVNGCLDGVGGSGACSGGDPPVHACLAN